MIASRERTASAASRCRRLVQYVGLLAHRERRVAGRNIATLYNGDAILIRFIRLAVQIDGLTTKNKEHNNKRHAACVLGA